MVLRDLRDEILRPHRQLGIPPTTVLSGLLHVAHKSATDILCKESQDQKGLWWSFSCPAPPPPLRCSAFGGIGKALGTMVCTQAYVCKHAQAHGRRSAWKGSVPNASWKLFPPLPLHFTAAQENLLLHCWLKVIRNISIGSYCEKEVFFTSSMALQINLENIKMQKTLHKSSNQNNKIKYFFSPCFKIIFSSWQSSAGKNTRFSYWLQTITQKCLLVCLLADRTSFFTLENR